MLLLRHSRAKPQPLTTANKSPMPRVPYSILRGKDLIQYSDQVISPLVSQRSHRVLLLVRLPFLHTHLTANMDYAAAGSELSVFSFKSRESHSTAVPSMPHIAMGAARSE